MKFIKSQTSATCLLVSYCRADSFLAFDIEFVKIGEAHAWRIRGRRQEPLSDPILATFDDHIEATKAMTELVSKIADTKQGGGVLYAWPPHYKEKGAINP